MSATQKQKSIKSLHESAELAGFLRPLEISTKSMVPLGVNLSAFNLKAKSITAGRLFTVETLYQSSKVFEKGGPYRDILDGTSKEAKKDSRLLNSGRLIGFNLFGEEWPLEPKTAFYDWIYINCLAKNESLGEIIDQYGCFSDIEFNPKKSINCQAYAVALYQSLAFRGLLKNALSSKNRYLSIVENRPLSDSVEDNGVQPRLL